MSFSDEKRTGKILPGNMFALMITLSASVHRCGSCSIKHICATGEFYTGATGYEYGADRQQIGWFLQQSLNGKLQLRRFDPWIPDAWCVCE